MNIFLDDNLCKKTLTPLSLTRHVSEIRIGISSIREKWELLVHNKGYHIIISTENCKDYISIPANIIPTNENYTHLIELSSFNKEINESSAIKIIKYPWHIFQYNDWALRKDFEYLTQNRISAPISSSNNIINTKDIFVEEGAQIEYSSLNASSGPIYIGKNTQIMEGSLIRGPFSLGENSVVKMGTKIYGATTIGQNCVVGGEIKNSILLDNSNKAHDGYLGDSVIGAWCNLGAGTSNSNVKNNGSEVKYQIDTFAEPISAGNKAGLIMGDFSRSAINTSFNTGSIVGVCCNIFEPGFPPKYSSNFSWGKKRYELDKAISDIDNWKKMKNNSITTAEIEILTSLYSKEK